jgi:ABC-type ATPase involved in cell division
MPDVELPNFSVITGPNGAGKTHLLKAIQEGAITADGETLGQRVQYFDWQTLVPQSATQATADSVYAERHQFMMDVVRSRASDNCDGQVLNNARQLDLPTEWLQNIRELSRRPLEDFVERFGDGDGEKRWSQVQNAVDASSQNLLNPLPPNYRARLSALAAHFGRKASALTDEELMSTDAPFSVLTSGFQQAFSTLFVRYRETMIGNVLKEYANRRGESSSKPLTDEQFIEKFGPPPWDFVNATLREANLPFEISKPDLFANSPFTAILKKIGTDITIPFEALSSGEKVLISFAFCIYNATDKLAVGAFPKVILFDEIDAPLHPSMIRYVIAVIQEILVKKLGTVVVITTHSPTTVALSPEESVFIFDKKVEKASKDAAIRLLTTEIPTLSISFDGRRQIFVESPRDAQIFGALYETTKSMLSNPISLEFVATGSRGNNSSDENTGCAVVVRLVNELAAAGNKSVYGLIDYDGKNEGSERIAILCGGNRNGLENALLDPLVLVCVLINEGERHWSTHATMSYVELSVLNPDTLQALVSDLAAHLFGRSDDNVEITYWGGIRLNAPGIWLSMDDHALEDKIISTFPKLRRHTNGSLCKFIAEKILRDMTNYIPIDLIDTLKGLQA